MTIGTLVFLMVLAAVLTFAGVLLYAAWPAIKQWRRARGAHHKPPVGGWREDQIINTSVVLGVVVSLLVALLVAIIISSATWWLGVPLLRWLLGGAVGIGVGAIYFLSTLVITKEGHHDVVYLFGRRWRRGPHGLGLPEGLNSLLIPNGIATVKPEDMRERTEAFDEIDEYSLNDVLVTLKGTANWRVLDPYEWQSVANGIQTLQNIMLQGFRDEMMLYRSHTLRQQQADGTFAVVESGIIDMDKTKFSDKVRVRINDILDANRDDPNRKSLVTSNLVEVVSIQARAIELPEDLNKRLNDRESEAVDREGERLQAQSRRDQINIITHNGQSNIDERLAALMVLSDAGKQGPVMVHVSADKGVSDAMSQVGKGVGEAGGGLGRGIELLGTAIGSYFSDRATRSKGRK